MDPTRREALLAVGCVCCWRNHRLGLRPSLLPVEIHHLNGGGHHGQPRRGDEFTIPLCVWHHRGLGPAAKFTSAYGPSWAKGSRPFRKAYGTDDELLAVANRLAGLRS